LSAASDQVVHEKFEPSSAGCDMDTLNTSFERDTARAWEESIWLDRREGGCLLTSESRGRLARLRNWLRSFTARMQLGPPADDGGWSIGDPEKRF